jgi:toxin ParE1/3/4
VIEAEWTAPAQADLAAIDDELAAKDPDYADRVGAAAIAAAGFLAEWPRAGPKIGRRRRKWPVQGTPYFLFYRIHRNRLEITRVRHAKENWRLY